MSRFHDLPNEIVCSSLHYLLPEDLASFARVSKWSQAIAQPVLENHRELVQRFSILDDISTVGPLLAAIAADPQIAYYVRKVDFSPTRERTRKPEIPVDWKSNPDLLKKAYDLVMSTAHNAQLDYPMGGPSSNFLRHMQSTVQAVCDDTNDDLAIAFLLAMLSNLNTLSFHWEREHYPWVKDVFTYARSPTSPIVKNLRSVLIRQEVNLKALANFSAIPSLQSLSAPRTTWLPRTEQDYASGLPFHDSNVTYLHLWPCLLDIPILIKYLKSFKKLESFVCALTGTRGLSYADRREAEDEDEDENENENEDEDDEEFGGGSGTIGAFNPIPLRKTLLHQGKTTLSTLSLLYNGPDISNSTSLRDFQVLKNVHIDWRILLQQPHTAGSDLSLILPASLEDLKIHDYKRPSKALDIQAKYAPVVDDIIDCKSNGLPLLQNMGFTAKEGLYRGTTARYSRGRNSYNRLQRMEDGFGERCERVGIVFGFEKLEIEGSWNR